MTEPTSRSGIKTTEFGVTGAMAALATLALQTEQSDAVKLVALIVAGTTAVAYTLGRSHVKAAHAPAQDT